MNSTNLKVGKVLEFETTLRELLHSSASFYQTGDKVGEAFYSGFMLCLLSILSPSYQIESERESGRGPADVVLIPRAAYGKDQALVVEYKVGQDVSELAAVAEAGLWKISTKGYGTQAKPMPMSRSCYKFA
ncbi:MAG: PD-(D/E)XK nuclease domain-containing protein [Bacteroidota bacterium]